MHMILAVIAVLIATFLIWTVVGKIKHGSSCCGEHESPVEKLRAGDCDPSHYPYRYRAVIDGMVCASCVRKVENAFNGADGIYASVNLRKKEAQMLSKRPLKRGDAVDILKHTSYTLLDFEEEMR